MRARMTIGPTKLETASDGTHPTAVRTRRIGTIVADGQEKIALPTPEASAGAAAALDAVRPARRRVSAACSIVAATGLIGLAIVLGVVFLAGGAGTTTSRRRWRAPAAS